MFTRHKKSNKSLFTLLMIITLFASCKNENKTLDVNTDPLELFDKLLDNYGGSKFWTSTSTFNYGDIYYTALRNNNILESSMSINGDGKNYLATYKNGFSEYFIDSIPQNDNNYKSIFIDSKLDAFIYLLSIPHSLSGTDVALNNKDNVLIKGKSYNVLHAKYKVDPNQTGDEFYLYIDTDELKIKFIAYHYKLSGAMNKFRAYDNFRIENGIVFTDYDDYISSSPETPLEEFYKLFNEDKLKLKDSVALTNIEVTPTKL